MAGQKGKGECRRWLLIAKIVPLTMLNSVAQKQVALDSLIVTAVLEVVVAPL